MFFVVKWENPSTVSFIDKYELILAFDGQNESPVHINKTNTNYTISNRIPGRTYTIILRSVETQTRPTQQVDGFSHFTTKKVSPVVPSGTSSFRTFNPVTIKLRKKYFKLL
jgi:hypothetical protein